MMKPRELLKKLAGSLKIIITAEPELTDEQLEKHLRNVQLKWKLERPFLLSTPN